MPAWNVNFKQAKLHYIMLKEKFIAFLFLISTSLLCVGNNNHEGIANRYNYQLSLNYARFGNIDNNAIILKNAVNKELKNGKITLGLNFGGCEHMRENFFYVNLNGNEYTDFLDHESMIYSNFLYSIRPVNSKYIKFYLGVGPSIGMFSKKYYQFWYKESDVDRHIFLMGEYQGGFDIGYSIDLQLLIKMYKENSLIIRGGYDSFAKYQSLFYIGLGIQLH